MDLPYCMRELKANASVIESLVQAVDETQARWKPADEDWSILEVLGHLLDEEKEDFPHRIRHLLSGNRDTWQGIRPGEWVLERKYNQQHLPDVLAHFLAERQKNVTWLHSLADPDWGIQYTHQPLAGIAAGDFLAAWTVHDLLHIRQITELKYRFSENQLQGSALRYAGDW